VFLVAYFVLQLCFWLPEMGNHQEHTLEVFNCIAHNVIKDTISYARIQAYNVYYQGILWPKNEQEVGFFSNLLDRGAIQPGKDF
jgi:hypothetical protein